MKKNFDLNKNRLFLPTLSSLLPDLQKPFMHRDLSWLQFNQRVLEQARPTSHNLPLERVKFLAISSSNLDEFFMVRVASLKKEIIKTQAESKDCQRLLRTFELLLERVLLLTARQSEIIELLSEELNSYGIEIKLSLHPKDKAYKRARKIFQTQVAPKLTAPQDFEWRHLTKLPNLHSGVLLGEKLWIEIPANLPSVLVAEDRENQKLEVFFLDTLLRTFLDHLSKEPGKPVVLRLTRDADVTTELVEEGVPPTPTNVRLCLQGIQSGKPIRLEYIGSLGESFLVEAALKLGLASKQCFSISHTLCYQGLWSLVLHPPSWTSDKLLYAPIRSFIPEPFVTKKSIFKRIKQKDILLHHPYDSFESFMIWIQSACNDPKVKEINLTMYRIGTLSPLIKHLITAAKRGKKVSIFIELRARFDEHNNILLSEELIAGGVQVHFGFGKLKLHAKAALIVRQERAGEKLYTHLSTGNYNATTAKLYTDLAILTADEQMGQDAQKFFQALSAGELPKGLKKIVTAPTNLHRRLLSLVDGEIEAAKRGEDARIVAKVNALVDEQFVSSLYKASQNGVKVDLIVRGACSLIPGVPDLSENIRVISLIDRFLEHSRLYFFGHSNQVYLSSADAMPRNFYRRLELGFPISDPDIVEYIRDFILPAYFLDSVKARELTSHGVWKKRTRKGKKEPFRAQFYFSHLAQQSYEGTPLSDSYRGAPLPSPSLYPSQDSSGSSLHH